MEKKYVLVEGEFLGLSKDYVEWVYGKAVARADTETVPLIDALQFHLNKALKETQRQQMVSLTEAGAASIGLGKEESVGSV